MGPVDGVGGVGQAAEQAHRLGARLGAAVREDRAPRGAELLAGVHAHGAHEGAEEGEVRGGPARLVFERGGERVGVDPGGEQVVGRRAGAGAGPGVHGGVVGVGVEVAPDGEAAERVAARAARGAGQAVPEALSVLGQHELDQARAQLAVLGAAQQRDRVAGDGGAALRGDVVEAVGSVHARDLGLDAAIEVDADAGGGVAGRDVLRRLAGRVGEVAGVGADALQKMDAREPAVLDGGLIAAFGGVRRFEGSKVCRFEGLQVCRFAGLQVCRFAGLKV